MEKTSQSRKRKEMADEKEELSAKRRKLVKDIDRLESNADKNIQIAAETGNLGLTTQIENISVKIKNA